MKKLGHLRACESLRDLAELFDYKPSTISYLLYIKDRSELYYEFEIPKRAGGTRQICAPAPELALLQSRLSQYLQDCIEEINSKRSIDSTVSHGFRRGYSIITNAESHLNKRFVFNLDLADFFGAINFGRVRGFFIKNQHFKLNHRVATVIAQIACHNNQLPQGSPCSPVVSNLVGHILDMRLVQLAKKLGCTYTRYADDLTFSSNLKKIPRRLARKKIFRHSWVPGSKLKRIIKDYGFTINPKKTRMQYHTSRQEVTGLTVNEKVNVPNHYSKNARAMAHSLFNKGEFYIRRTKVDVSGVEISEALAGTLDELQGMLSFIDSVDAFNYWKRDKIAREIISKKKVKQELNKRERLFSDFLVFRRFYATEIPLIICEGQTDGIYIKSAIKELGAKFPKLAKINKTGTLKLRFEVFKYTKLTKRLLALNGGDTQLKDFAAGYAKRCKTFGFKPKQQPIICIFDNDSGAKGIICVVNSFRKKTGAKSITGNEPFTHVVNNLYVLIIPKRKSRATEIEDYFLKSVLKKKYKGKSFNPNVIFETKTEFGKVIFAHQIVKKNQSKIDFKRFKPFLANLEKAISSKHHQMP